MQDLGDEETGKCTDCATNVFIDSVKKSCANRGADLSTPVLKNIIFDHQCDTIRYKSTAIFDVVVIIISIGEKGKTKPIQDSASQTESSYKAKN